MHEGANNKTVRSVVVLVPRTITVILLRESSGSCRFGFGFGNGGDTLEVSVLFHGAILGTVSSL